MNRRLIASLIVGTGLACGVLALVPALAQDRESRDKESGAGPKPNAASENSSSKIDKAIQVYESRTEQDLDQTRKDIDRLRKELMEMIELRIDMTIASAQLRADLGNRTIGLGSDESPYAGSSQSISDPDERRHQRAADLYREVKQIQEQLRNEVAQAKAQTDQSVAQLRALRAQVRQKQEQAKADRERSKKTEEKSKTEEKPKDDANR